MTERFEKLKDWKTGEMDAEKKQFIREHTFRCDEHWDGITIVRRVFGVQVDSWVEFNGGLDIRPDTISYVERIFRDEVRNTLGIDFDDKLYIIGMTYEVESNGDNNNQHNNN